MVFLEDKVETFHIVVENMQTSIINVDKDEENDDSVEYFKEDELMNN